MNQNVQTLTLLEMAFVMVNSTLKYASLMATIVVWLRFSVTFVSTRKVASAMKQERYLAPKVKSTIMHFSFEITNFIQVTMLKLNILATFIAMMSSTL